MRLYHSEQVALTPMDVEAIRALRACRFLPGSFAKGLARSLYALVDAGAACISVRQKYWLWELCYRYRRQIAGDVRNEAQRRHEPPKDFRQPLLW
jgi:hypothetical protein